MNEYSKVGWQDGTVLQPAKVTIEGTDYEVDPAVESGTTPVNATNLDKMDTALKQAHDGVRSLSTNKIDKSTIELLTVDSTAPITCSEGDMYYNTTTNLIYTATGTDTWGTTGETPSSKYLYVDLTNSKLYYYDGATFTSYGGGASNDVIISDTQPTGDDWKLWIDSDEVGSQVSEITNEYSTSTGKGYSANYVNTELDKKITNETTQSTVSQCTFYKIGKIVIASGWFVINGASATFTAPYKPVSRLWIPTNGVDSSVNPSGLNGFIDILDTGNISVKMTSAVTYCTATFCYITND